MKNNQDPPRAPFRCLPGRSRCPEPGHLRGRPDPRPPQGTGHPLASKPAGRQALIVLAHLRHDQRPPIWPAATASRRPPCAAGLEVIKLLAAKAPRLERALGKIARSGGEAVLSTAPSCAPADAPGKPTGKNYSGKHKSTACSSSRSPTTAATCCGSPQPNRGAPSDITAARHDHITEQLRAAGLGALADLGFVGLDDDPDDPVIITGGKPTRKTAHRRPEGGEPADRRRPRAQRTRLRRPQGLAHPHQVRMKPGTATDLLRALLVLTNLEVTR